MSFKFFVKFVCGQTHIYSHIYIYIYWQIEQVEYYNPLMTLSNLHTCLIMNLTKNTAGNLTRPRPNFEKVSRAKPNIYETSFTFLSPLYLIFNKFYQIFSSFDSRHLLVKLDQLILAGRHLLQQSRWFKTRHSSHLLRNRKMNSVLNQLPRLLRSFRLNFNCTFSFLSI